MNMVTAVQGDCHGVNWTMGDRQTSVSAEDAVNKLVSLCSEIANGVVRSLATEPETNWIGTHARAAQTNTILFDL